MIAVGHIVRAGRARKLGEARALFEIDGRARARCYFPEPTVFDGVTYPDYEQHWDLSELEPAPGEQLPLARHEQLALFAGVAAVRRVA